jgi:hypothetical protein
MADLIDRVAGTPYQDDRPKIAHGPFFADMILYAEGLISIAEAREDHDLGANASAAEINQATAIIDAIDAAGNITAKLRVILRIEAVMHKLEYGPQEEILPTRYYNADRSLNKTNIIADAGI